MPYTGYCKWDLCDIDKTRPNIKVSDYMFEKYWIILCKKHMKLFKKLSTEEKESYAKSKKEFGLPRHEQI